MPSDEQTVAPVADDAPVSEWVEAARARISDMCHGGRWHMTIPARPNFDHDLVISSALTMLERELAEARRDVDRVTSIGTKLQHDVAEAAGMDTLGEEASCTELVVEAVRELRAKVEQSGRDDTGIPDDPAAWSLVAHILDQKPNPGDEFVVRVLEMDDRGMVPHGRVYVRPANRDGETVDYDVSYEYEERLAPEALSDD